MRNRVFIFTILLITLCSAAVFAGTASQAYTSKANSYSKAVEYEFSATATRTGQTTAKVEWSLTPSWAKGGESKSHGYPTKITAKIASGDTSKSVTVKKKGINTFSVLSGSFDITVKEKTSSVPVSLKATGSGSYKEKVEEKYTYYTTQWYRRDARNTGAIGAGSSSGSTPTIVWGNWYAVSSSGSNTNLTQYRSSRAKHTGTHTVTKTRKTNSGTLSKKTLKPNIALWYWVRYHAVTDDTQNSEINSKIASTLPATHGFIGGQGTTISTQNVSFYSNVIRKDAYTMLGWSTTEARALTASTLALDGNNDYKNYIDYDPGASYTKDSDLDLYCARKPNMIGTIVFHANTDGKGNDDKDVTNMPKNQEKYYNVPIVLGIDSDGKEVIPVRPDIETKEGTQRYAFLCWSTTPDPATGTNFNAGSSFNLNYNPDEEIPESGQSEINLYAIWYDGTDPKMEDPEDDSYSNIRYIAKEYLDTLTKSSKWRTGERLKELQESLNSTTPKSVYDSEGKKIK